MSETTKKKQLPRYKGHSRLARSGQNGHLSVPADMMALLTEGLLFKPELTKDGILFKIVDENKIAMDEKAVPAWVKKAVPADTGPIPPVDDDHPDNDLSDEVIHGVEDGDHGVLDAQEGEDEPPTDDDSPF